MPKFKIVVEIEDNFIRPEEQCIKQYVKYGLNQCFFKNYRILSAKVIKDGEINAKNQKRPISEIMLHCPTS